MPGTRSAELRHLLAIIPPARRRKSRAAAHTGAFFPHSLVSHTFRVTSLDREPQSSTRAVYTRSSPCHFRRRPGRRDRRLSLRRVRSSLARATSASVQRRSYARACLSRDHEQRRKQFWGAETTLSQAWSGNCIRGPQCAFEMSMFMCPAVHKLTRN